MKKGAYDYLLKPFKVEEVIHVVERALYRQRLQAENIRLREALTIYKVCEAIALSHDIEHILDVVLRAALDEVKADVATLHLRDPRSGHYEERVKVVAADDAIRGRPALARVRRARPSSSRRACRSSRTAARRRGSSPRARRPQSWRRSSRCRCRCAANMVGVLNVFSFTPGKKFDEGHRKMLAVLASRAASAIDNARLYGELRVDATTT